MRLFFRWLGPRNSLIVAWDVKAEGDIQLIQNQMTEVARYYDPSPFKTLASPDRPRRTLGCAHFIFREPTKAFYLNLFPWLRDQGYPFSLVIRPSILGTNRLSLKEEFTAYQRIGRLPHGLTYAEWKKRFRDTDEAYQALRSEGGAFPVSETQPLDYSVTWGKLVEMIAEKGEVGLYLDDLTVPHLVSDESFIRKQIKQGPSYLFSDDFKGAADLNLPIVSSKDGMVLASTSIKDLPLFRILEESP